MNWKRKIVCLFSSVSLIFLMVSGVLAAGIVGQNGFGTSSAVMDSISGKGYSGGLDVVYAQIASGSAASKTRCFLKCEDGLFGHSDATIRVDMFAYTGKYIGTFAELVDPFGAGGQYAAFSGTVKVAPVALPSGDKKIWFSMTGSGSSDGAWYSVTVDPDFTSATSEPTYEFSQPGNFEVEWDPVSGNAFFGGKENDAWSDPYALFIRQGNTLVKIVEVGGYSTGFAFTPDGTLCVGSYTSSGPADQQYIYVFTSEQVQSAIENGTVLTPAHAANTIALYNPNGVYLGVNDIESDPSGNIYVSANGAWDETYDSDVGYIFKISNPLTAPDLTESDIIARGTMTEDEPDWQKALAYDGESQLVSGGHYNPVEESGGNRLYVDQDFSWGSGGPDMVCGIAYNTDSDGDGIPDSLDNAYLTSNPGQQDTDGDMYGNICDADLNNDGTVGGLDYSAFRSAWGSSGSGLDADFNQDGTVTSEDYSILRNRWGESAPYY